jgi:threonylcarbamoyladenosine tRNA methylthiotransferase CDKAL1
MAAVDIEDAPIGAGQMSSSATARRANAVPRRTQAKQHDAAALDSAQPPTKTVYMHTFGCGHNVSDGEYMAGQLAEGGYVVSEQFEGADCFVINSCTVKNPSEDHFVDAAEEGTEHGQACRRRRLRAAGRP